jgi:hypothetical protein
VPGDAEPLGDFEGFTGLNVGLNLLALETVMPLD